MRLDDTGRPDDSARRADVVHLGPHTVGIAERFRIGERARVAQVLESMEALGVSDLRLAIAWADDVTDEGARFHDWLLPTLAARVRVVPCVGETPPSLGVEPRRAAPPRTPKSFEIWLDAFLDRHGEHFEHVELWDAPNARGGWDSRLDPDRIAFAACIRAAARRVRARGKKAVLGGLHPVDPDFLRRLADRGVLSSFDAIGLHVQPEVSEPEWTGWARPVNDVRAALEELGARAEVWITAGGYSTWRHDDARQAHELLEALESGAERLYWHAMHDLPEQAAGPSGPHVDEREYAFGLRRADGTPKLLHRWWADGGLANVRAQVSSLHASATGPRRRPTTLITGGAGFIGSNLAHALLSRGEDVLLFDNLSRPGVERNVRWLREQHGERVRVAPADLRDASALRDAVRHADRVFHFAAQVAVTTSLLAPREDFAINAGGTLSLLEALRELDEPPPLVFTSTNKVYGALADVPLSHRDGRYTPRDPVLRANGIGERRTLDFHSPYGCSKGVADQYVLDYARCFGLPATVFRMSCIYGPRQLGNEEQGWVAHFLARALRRESITIYGDGMQMRDVLYVGDLVDAFLLASAHIDAVRGQAFNVGGGPENAVSLLDVLERIEQMLGEKPDVRFGAWRRGDQRYYCSDTRKLQETIGWRPRTSVDEGLSRLRSWLDPRPRVPRAAGDGSEA